MHTGIIQLQLGEYEPFIDKPEISWQSVQQSSIPKQDNLYPETGNNFVAVLATKSPVSGWKVSVFGNQCGQAFRSRNALKRFVCDWHCQVPTIAAAQHVNIKQVDRVVGR